MNMFASLATNPVRVTCQPTKDGAYRYGMRPNSGLSKIKRYVADHPGCSGSDVISGLRINRQVAHAGLWALEHREILTSRMKRVPVGLRRANDPEFQKHYWVAA